MISIQEQQTMWVNHSLNMDTMKIRLPNGELVSQAKFNHMYIGEVFELVNASMNKTRNAYTAYVKNQPVTYWNKNIPSHDPWK